MDTPEWRQLYVNAEHDGTIGVVTMGRESLNADVIDELNRAFDWLKTEGVSRVILTGDFHLATQMVGADTAEFYPALEDAAAGARLATGWSRTARRLEDDFEVSVGFVNGKRCLGGMLELMVHCHSLVAVEDASLGFPEVTLPVVPGMEGCHWTFRKSPRDGWPKVAALLLSGVPVRAKSAVGWLVDVAEPLDAALASAARSRRAHSAACLARSRDSPRPRARPLRPAPRSRTAFSVRAVPRWRMPWSCRPRSRATS
jgi:enoyl-CoA hydratase/carnithine racemase